MTPTEWVDIGSQTGLLLWILVELRKLQRLCQRTEAEVRILDKRVVNMERIAHARK